MDRSYRGGAGNFAHGRAVECGRKGGQMSGGKITSERAREMGRKGGAASSTWAKDRAAASAAGKRSWEVRRQRWADEAAAEAKREGGEP